MKAALALMGALAAGGSLTWVAASASPDRVLGAATTDFDDRLLDQRHNALLAAKKLNGRVVKPGAVFSFNEAVGSWSLDQGYRKAPVSFSGTLVPSWGGGVCQTSTTLYVAALQAGMVVVERHRHHFAANYVPPGFDAAVAYPAIDLKFRNPNSCPVRIETRVSGNRMTLALVGAAEPPKVRLQNRVVQHRAPSSLVIGEGPFGRVRNPGKEGWEVFTYRLTACRRELLSVDSYPSMSRVVERFESPK